MTNEKKREDEGKKGQKARVNPAARHDPPSAAAGEKADDRKREQVPPGQQEPLDPLGPGGIGA